MFGTEEPTLMDVIFMPFLETFTDWNAPSCMANVLQDCNYAKSGGDLIDQYVAKFRAHPLVSDVTMRPKASREHWQRTRNWPKGEKCSLTVDYLQTAFD
jgi:hypothetical protein